MKIKDRQYDNSGVEDGNLTQVTQNVVTSIVKHATSYNALGLPYQATSYNSSNAVVNQVQYGYNGFGQETTEYQEHSGSVSTSTSAKIQYAYADGSANTIRLTSQTFNNGRILDYGYTSGLDADISRVSYIADDGGTSAGVHLENYSYLGLGTVVKRGHPETGVDQTLIGSGTGDGGDQYVGLDRFGRVVLQNWTNGTTSSDEYEYAYDRNGNALYQKNDLSSVNSELYHANSGATGDNNSAYDTLNRLTGFRRGTLSSSAWNGSGLDTVSSLSTVFTNNQELWTLDALGNWSSQTIDGSASSRVHNKKNQATTVGTHTLTFDNNGNTTTDNVSQTYIYDAWNHIIQVKDSGGTPIVTYSYDANQRRITAVSPTTSTRDLYYDTQWRIIEEYYGGTLNDQNIFTVNGYIDDVVLVDHDATSGGSYGKTSSGLDQRLYEMQDDQHRSTGLVNTSGTVVERFQYDPYGNVTDMNASWGAATTGYAWEFLWKGMRLQTRDDIYYVRNRDYSPTLGRFLQEDPSGYVDGANLYQFVVSNPIVGRDPSGLKEIHERKEGMMVPHAISQQDWKKLGNFAVLEAAINFLQTMGFQTFKIWDDFSWDDKIDGNGVPRGKVSFSPEVSYNLKAALILIPPSFSLGKISAGGKVDTDKVTVQPVWIDFKHELDTQITLHARWLIHIGIDAVKAKKFSMPAEFDIEIGSGEVTEVAMQVQNLPPRQGM